MSEPTTLEPGEVIIPLSMHLCVGTDEHGVLCRHGWVFRLCRHPKCDGIPHRERLCLCACHGGV